MVRSPRLELGRCNHTPLKRTRLPIPPWPLNIAYYMIKAGCCQEDLRVNLKKSTIFLYAYIWICATVKSGILPRIFPNMTIRKRLPLAMRQIAIFLPWRWRISYTTAKTRRRYPMLWTFCTYWLLLPKVIEMRLKNIYIYANMYTNQYCRYGLKSCKLSRF